MRISDWSSDVCSSDLFQSKGPEFMVKKQCIENRTFDEISIGEEASLSRTLTSRDIELFAAMSGDVNPAHVDEAFAESDMFHKIIAHGMWGGALIRSVKRRVGKRCVSACR